MKKSISTLIFLTLAVSTGFAQITERLVSQPTHVIAKKIDASGQTTSEITFDYSYDATGKLTRYDCPEYSLSKTFHYNNDFLMEESTFHQGGEHPFYETTSYTYENGQVKTIVHEASQMEASQYQVFSYYADGRLERKDQKDELDDDYHMHWIYEYGDDERTVTESYWTSWVSQGMLLRKKTVSQYDEAFNLISKQSETYDIMGNLTGTTHIGYSYTEHGKVESEITQTLVGNEWINTSIVAYEYNENDQLSTILDGIWNQESGEWFFTHKITFELAEEGIKYIVSFFKEHDGDWVWGIFDNQTILFGDNLKAQQRLLTYMVYESFHGSANINQFEFTLTQTEQPTYVSIEENVNESVTLHPNPTTGQVTITGKYLKQAEVFNTLGQRVATATDEGETLHIDLANLPAGVYFVNVSDGEGRKCVRKVVKE